MDIYLFTRELYDDEPLSTLCDATVRLSLMNHDHRFSTVVSCMYVSRSHIYYFFVDLSLFCCFFFAFHSSQNITT